MCGGERRGAHSLGFGVPGSPVVLSLWQGPTFPEPGEATNEAELRRSNVPLVQLESVCRGAAE